MSGKLLIISGFSCTGKTTYIGAMHTFFNKSIARRDFHTNRPPRTEEERINSPDYNFITKSEHIALSNQHGWHWVKWYNFDYGFHIQSEISRLKNGENIVIGSPPHTSYLLDMQGIHGIQNVHTIFLNVGYETILKRLKQRPPHEHRRIHEYDQNEIDVYASISNNVFTPVNNIEIDCQNIIRIATQILCTQLSTHN